MESHCCGEQSILGNTIRYSYLEKKKNKRHLNCTLPDEKEFFSPRELGKRIVVSIHLKTAANTQEIRGYNDIMHPRNSELR